MEQEITLKQALLGFKIEVTHLDGHTFTLEKKRGQITQPGETMKVTEEGMPKFGSPSEFGDLYVTFKVKNPVSLSDGQRTLLK